MLIKSQIPLNLPRMPEAKNDKAKSESGSRPRRVSMQNMKVCCTGACKHGGVSLNEGNLSLAAASVS